MYETIDGFELPYKGYKSVLSGSLKPIDIMGSSGLQGAIVFALGLFIGNKINRKKYRIVSNETGVHLSPATNLAMDLAIYDKKDTVLDDHYMTQSAKVIIEVDVKADITEAPFLDEDHFILEKSKKIIASGTEKVIWILTAMKKIYVFTNDEWKFQNFNSDITIIENCVLNLEHSLTEEEISF